MNCPLNLVLKTCLKLDLGFRRSLFSFWCRSRRAEYYGLLRCSNSCPRQFHSSRPVAAPTNDETVLLSPQEVTLTLRKNEFNKEFTTGSVKSFDSNQLASNDPMEDTRSEAKCIMTPATQLPWKFPTIREGRKHGELIEAYNMLTGKYNCPGLQDIMIVSTVQSVRRSNNMQLARMSSNINIRFHLFNNRLMSTWNSPPQQILKPNIALDSGLLMGVFDGHGGPACAQVISKRLLQYVAAALLPKDKLQKYCEEKPPRKPLLETYNDIAAIVEDLKDIYEKSFNQYLAELKDSNKKEHDVRSSLEDGITKLDRDLSVEVLDHFKSTGRVNPKTLSVALSGAVACVTHIDGPHLHVANVGDCNAVLGVMTEENTWIAKKITKEHNTENIDELKRIWSEHPDNEKRTVIRRDRLLGELAPLRSLGDYRYKWPMETLSDVAVPVVGQHAIPPNYLTPPYLTAKPDVFYHRLSPKDKFLIIASDGLWDMLTPLQSVMLVGEHMKGKVHFNPLKLPKKNIQLGDINELLLHRKESLKSKPKDRNAATHLIRHAVGGTEYGVDHSRLAHLLSLTPDVSRMFRDDITVTVVYFDSEFLRQCPA